MRHLIDSCDRYIPFCLIVIFTVVSLCVCFNVCYMILTIIIIIILIIIIGLQTTDL